MYIPSRADSTANSPNTTGPTLIWAKYKDLWMGLDVMHVLQSLLTNFAMDVLGTISPIYTHPQTETCVVVALPRAHRCIHTYSHTHVCTHMHVALSPHKGKMRD